MAYVRRARAWSVLLWRVYLCYRSYGHSRTVAVFTSLVFMSRDHYSSVPDPPAWGWDYR